MSHYDDDGVRFGFGQSRTQQRMRERERRERQREERRRRERDAEEEREMEQAVKRRLAGGDLRDAVVARTLELLKTQPPVVALPKKVKGKFDLPVGVTAARHEPDASPRAPAPR